MKHTATAGKAPNRAKQARLGSFSSTQQWQWPKATAEQKKSTRGVMDSMEQGRLERRGTWGDKRQQLPFQTAEGGCWLVEGAHEKSRRLRQPRLWASLQSSGNQQSIQPSSSCYHWWSWTKDSKRGKFGQKFPSPDTAYGSIMSLYNEVFHRCQDSSKNRYSENGILSCVFQQTASRARLTHN